MVETGRVFGFRDTTESNVPFEKVGVERVGDEIGRRVEEELTVFLQDTFDGGRAEIEFRCRRSGRRGGGGGRGRRGGGGRRRCER